MCVTKGVGALYVIMDVIRRKMRERKEEEERITHFKSIQESVNDEFVDFDSSLLHSKMLVVQTSL